MTINEWEKGVRIHASALESFLAKALATDCRIKLNEADEENKAETLTQLQEADICIKAPLADLETELFFAYAGTPGGMLFPAEEKEDRQQQRENRNLLELTGRFLTILQQAWHKMGTGIDVAAVRELTDEERPGSLSHDHYFTAELEIGFPAEADQNEENPLKLMVALARPNTQDIGPEILNLFGDEGYPSRIARHMTEVALPWREETSKAREPKQNNINLTNRNKKVEFEDFKKSENAETGQEVRNIDILKNIEMNLSVELGRRKIPLGEVLQLVKGSVVELEKLSGEPVEILINGHQIARGDVVVIDEHFGVRISELLATQEHMKDLG
ncbi:flagellar motor switch protein FliN [Fodinibius sediminis]|uniref:Flagellar motor switch protein FliN n=1 Tax=Fodinibius sediminis TaxID=1214077 RepID=A0A521CIG1_9BACT|nr:flagellar motor switch protein FliN [Fodinibius sediminis]SMO59239.1 flagellar motor switch protein FliN [Fodinibius sediminis]